MANGISGDLHKGDCSVCLRYNRKKNCWNMVQILVWTMELVVLLGRAWNTALGIRE